MELGIFEYLDIFFTISTMMLYVAFLFFTTHINSKFFIFFISCFANIFCYSIIIKKEYNFFFLVLLNVLFMLIMVFYYIMIDLDEKSLTQEFTNRSTLKHVLIISFFLCGLFFILTIFSIFYKKQELINSNYNVVPIAFNKVVKNSYESKLDNYGKIDNNIIVYQKNVRELNNKVFSNFNILVLVYICLLNVLYFTMSDKDKIVFFQKKKVEENKYNLEELEKFSIKK